MATLTAPSLDLATLQLFIDTYAVRGDTVILPAGTESWGTSVLELVHGIHLQGAGKGLTVIQSLLISSTSDLDAYRGIISCLPRSAPSPGGNANMTIDQTFRISDLTLDAMTQGGNLSGVWQYHGWGYNSAKLVVERVKFQRFTDITNCVQFKGQVRGGVFDCEFEDINYPVRGFGYNDQYNEWIHSEFYPYEPGDGDNFVVEDCVLSYSGAYAVVGNFFSPLWTEWGQSARVVWRYNRHDYTNVEFTGSAFMDGFDIHGFQSFIEQSKGTVTADASTDKITLASHGLSASQVVRFTTSGTLPAGLSASVPYYVRDVATNDFRVALSDSGTAIDITDAGSGTHTLYAQTSDGQTGTIGAEIYGNTLINFKGVRWLVFRGGRGRVFNNIFTDAERTCYLYMQQYGPGDEAAGGATPTKGGCKVCVTSSANGARYNPEVYDTYVWNNEVDGVIRAMTQSQNGCPPGTDENVGFFNYNASFDGSAGIGRGANIGSAPAGSLVNVGYYVNPSSVLPTVDPVAVQQTKLYKWNGSAWVLDYEPFTYPHPLRSDYVAPTDNDIAITAASFLPSAGAERMAGYLGEDVEQGDALYLKQSDGFLYKAQADDLATANVIGLAEAYGHTGQRISFVKLDAQLAIGGTLASGALVILSPDNPGKLALLASNAAGVYLNLLGIGIGANKMNFRPLLAGVPSA